MSITTVSAAEDVCVPNIGAPLALLRDALRKRAGAMLPDLTSILQPIAHPADASTIH